MSEITSPIMLDSTGQTIAGKLDNINASIGGNANIAPVFNTTTAYSKGDMVNYSGDLYVFTANHAAGAWTGSDAVQTKVSSELATLKSGFTNLIKLKSYAYRLSESLTIAGNTCVAVGALKTITGDDSANSLISGYVDSYNDVAGRLIIFQQPWYNTKNIYIYNADSTSATISANRDIVLFYV